MATLAPVARPFLSRLRPERRAPAESRFEGFVDALDGAQLSGWAWNRADPVAAIDVDIYVDRAYACSVTADQLGGDLAAAGIGNGLHRWTCAIADVVGDDRVHEISARFGGTDIELGHSPKIYLRDILALIPDLQLQALLAARHIRGKGIEIGALDKPQRVPEGVETVFVDRLTADELRAEYPEMSAYDLVPVGIVDDGEMLANVPDVSVDFAIANNFLEHCEDPLGTLKNFFRVVRPGGVIFLVIPNRRGNIDVDRPETTIEHLIHDHEHGPEGSRAEHYREWTRDVLKLSELEVEGHAQQLMRDGYSIHYHVFTEFEVLEMFTVLRRRYGLDFAVEHIANNQDHETVVVARRD